MTRVLKLAVVLLLVLAPSAQGAAPPVARDAVIKECGNADVRFDGSRNYLRFTYGEPSAGVWNITTRGVTCRTARQVVKRSYLSWCGDSVCRVRAATRRWTCRYTRLGEELGDSRCTAGSRVVRYQSGA